MHHLSCLSADKDCNNENIYFYMTECGENMNNFYHASFRAFWVDFWEVKSLNYHILYELCGYKDLGEV